MAKAKGGYKNSNKKNAGNVGDSACTSNKLSSACNGSKGNDLSSGIQNLQDVLRQITTKPVTIESLAAAGMCPYEHIVSMMQRLSLEDDGIVMNQKIKEFEVEFCNLMQDKEMVIEAMKFINQCALMDQEFAKKFAMLIASKTFDGLVVKSLKIQYLMLDLLETNFLKADEYYLNDKVRLYNSITLLGEYYHQKRLSNNQPLAIIGKSLISLLLRQIEKTDENATPISTKLAKLILSQITLNGVLLRTHDNENFTKLLNYIRRNLIEQTALTPTVKALLLMTLDLYNNNFSSLGIELEEMYTKYIVQSVAEEKESQNTPKATSGSEMSSRSKESKDPKTTTTAEESSEPESAITAKEESLSTAQLDAEEDNKKQQHHLEKATQQNNNAKEESKPLPKWRQIRFNQKYNNQPNVDSDRQLQRNKNQDKSTLIKGNILKIYSVSERLKYAQQKNDCNDSNYYSCSNSYRSQHDRCERTYATDQKPYNVNRDVVKNASNRSSTSNKQDCEHAWEAGGSNRNDSKHNYKERYLS